MLSNITELRKIHKEIAVLQLRENELKKPALEDFLLIPMLWEWFKELLSDIPLPHNPDGVIQRKKFIFVVITLYSPATFCGYLTTAGLCKELSCMFATTPANISRNISDMLFIYDNYKEFQIEADGMYEQIKSRLDTFLNTENL
jgi:hypothetical protein